MSKSDGKTEQSNGPRTIVRRDGDFMEEDVQEVPLSELYLCRDPNEFPSDPAFVSKDGLFSYYGLKEPYQQLSEASLPRTFAHFVRELRMPEDEKPGKASLAELLKSEPFDRPIEPFSENDLKAAFTLKVTPHIPVIKLKADASGDALANEPPPYQSGVSTPAPVTLHSNKVTEDDDAAKRDKKKRKKERRDKERAEEIQKLILQLLSDLLGLKWPQWQLNDGNPFTQKITRQNCKKLGVPDYFTYVQTPMDLMTMKEKWTAGQYKDLESFAADVRLMVKNAHTFNRPGEPVYNMAGDIAARFEQRYNEVKHYLDEKEQERKRRKKEKRKKDK